MWQSLFEELKAQGFVVLAVAQDHAEAARPWIEAASPGYPCLIDREHHLGDLYNLVNVPQALWIDEEGRIVRPAETAGATDGFRAMDRVKFTIAPEVMEERTRVKERYLQAVRDWVREGDASPHVLSPEAARARLGSPEPAIAEAHAFFRLGQALLARGREDEAAAQFAQAVARHPDSWSMWRQTARKDARGLATGPEFWARVDALGERPYYRPAEL